MLRVLFFFFQAEDGIRDIGVTGVQTCALPIYARFRAALEGLADSLQFALRYRLPERTARGLYVQYDPCLSGSEGTALSALGAVLLTLPDEPHRAVAAPPAPAPAARPAPAGATAERPDTVPSAAPRSE